MVCHKDREMCFYQYYQGIFLDVKVDNLVHIILVKLVSAQLSICGFGFIQQAKFLILVVLQERRSYYATHGVSCNGDFVFGSKVLTLQLTANINF
jgi:hypothetical protein